MSGKARKKAGNPEPKGDLSTPEFESLIQLAKRILWDFPETRRQAQRRGVQIVPARFYSDIPSIDEVETSFETLESRPFAFDFLDRDTLLLTLSELQPFADEFDPPEQAPQGEGFAWSNPAFSYSDALSYYAFVRARRPATIFEIGCGYSTLVAIEALARNGEGNLICLEPYPKDFLRARARTDARQGELVLLEQPAQTLNPEFLNDTLIDGDLLFIDSTHTVKTGSDCVHLYLRVLPKLRRRLLVHVHDIRLPAGLSPKRAIEGHDYWTEQHLLAGYLLDNPKVKAVLGSHWALLEARAELDEWMRGKSQSGGGSFWFELDGTVAV